LYSERGERLTRFFEVVSRDGAARIGRLLVRGGIDTPCIVSAGKEGSFIINSGNRWRNPEIRASDDAFFVYPYVGLPYHVRDELVKAIDPPEKIFSDKPSAAVIHPLQDVGGADMYIMAGARSIEGDARALLDSFIKIREKVPYDTALYVPALATPENVSLLVYLGADVVDDVAVTACAYQGLYLTADGGYSLEGLYSLPCSCEICSKHSADEFRAMEKEELYPLLERHNALKLGEELNRVKLHIKSGMLREYVEKQCRSRPWLTALLRLADAQYSYLEERAPSYRSSTMLACSPESQNRVEVKRFADRIRERFISDGEILLIIPCSARKPYSTSRSHMEIINSLGKLRNYVREVILTSPLGVVPRELELVYPAAHYDVAVTGVWDLEEKQWVSGCLRDFIGNGQFKKVIAHVEGAYVDVCLQTGKEMTFTSKGKVTGEESLANLEAEIKKAIEEVSPKPRGFNAYQLDMFRKMADHEFGKGKGSLLVPEKGTVKGKYPRYILFDGKEQLCSIIPEYGSLSLTIEGAKRMGLESEYYVEIGDFIPKGSILAPGIIKADPGIRVGDDVFVKGKKAIAIGKAKMSGVEMKRSGRGMAVELRKVEKI
jgi:archaeosine synthase